MSPLPTTENPSSHTVPSTDKSPTIQTPIITGRPNGRERTEERWFIIPNPKTVHFLSTPSPIPSSVVGLAAQQPDGGGVRDGEPICYLMRGYTRRLMTFRVRERLRRSVTGPTASSENENPEGCGGRRHSSCCGRKHAWPSHCRSSRHPGERAWSLTRQHMDLFVLLKCTYLHL